MIRRWAQMNADFADDPQMDADFAAGRRGSEGMNVRDPQTDAIIGAAMEVHRQLGHGFLESVYQEAMAIECLEQQIPFEREVQLTINYKGRPLDCRYRADFICFNDVLVELKALSQLTGAEEAQVLNYLKATGLTRALLINFGTPRLEYKRLVLNHPDED